MERDEIRLECIKLAVARTNDHTDCVKRAETYFEFIKKPEEVTEKEFVADKKSAKSSGTLRPS